MITDPTVEVCRNCEEAECRDRSYFCSEACAEEYTTDIANGADLPWLGTRTTAPPTAAEDPRRDEALRLFREGWSVRRVQLHFDVGQTVARKWRAAALPPPVTHPLAVALLASPTVTNVEISRRTGYGDHAVREMRQRLGISPACKGRPEKA